MAQDYDRETLQGLPSATAINDELAKIETALADGVSRTGNGPNDMESNLDLNSNRVINVGAPIDSNDAVTKGYLENEISDYVSASDAADAAIAAQAAAETAQAGAEAAETAAEAAYDDFDDRYLGAKASEPTVDNDGDALVTGALFFDTSAGVMKVYNGTSWVAITLATGGVDSVFGRTGDVVAATSDYDASQIDNDSGVAGATVDLALDNAAASGPVDSVFGRTGPVTAAPSDYDAGQIDYDNASSGLTATDVQAAIDELDTTVDGFTSAQVKTGISSQILDSVDLGTYDDGITVDHNGNLIGLNTFISADVRRFTGFSNTTDTTISPSEDLDGVTYDLVNEDLIGWDESSNEIYIYNGFSTTVSTTLSITGPQSVGVDASGNLVVFDGSDVTRYTGISDTVDTSFSFSFENSGDGGGIAFVDGNLCLACSSTLSEDYSVVYVFDGFSSTVIHRQPYTSTPNPGSVAVLGDRFLVQNSTDIVARYSPGKIVDGFPIALQTNNWSYEEIIIVSDAGWSNGSTSSFTVPNNVFPSYWKVYLECTSADANYSTGDIVTLPENITFNSSTGQTFGATSFWDDSAEGISVRIAANGILLLNSSYTTTVLTPANWTMRVYFMPQVN